MKNCRKSFFNFIQIVFWTLQAIWDQVFCLTGKIFSEDFSQLCLSCREEQFEIMNFFYWKYKSCWYTFGRWATTFLDMRRFLPAGSSMVYSSCKEEPFHGKKFLWEKNRTFCHLQKLSRNIFRNLAEVFHGCCHWLVLGVQTKLLRTFFEQQILILFDPYHSFLGILAYIFRNLFQNRIQQVEQKSWRGAFLGPSKSFFLIFPGKWAKVFRSIDDVFSEFFSKVHLTCPEQLFEVKKFFPKS